MGKSIIQQARGHGSSVYRVKKRAFQIKPRYPANINEEFEIIKLINSPAHSAPVAKLKAGKEIFFNIAAEGIYEGQKIKIGKDKGDISFLKDLEIGTRIFNIELKPGDGGKLVRSGGSYATVLNKSKGIIRIELPSKKVKEFDENCKCTIGTIAGKDRLDKPILKAGKMFYIKKSKSKKWPLTSAVKVNAIDHPFGSGRGKRIKSKIAKKNAPAGRRVGLLRPRRTGRTKR
ncbi:MAG: 50S ribosomal protein L2 [Nanoarchaeota archaeon]